MRAPRITSRTAQNVQVTGGSSQELRVNALNRLRDQSPDHGTTYATSWGMAAIFALVLVPALAAVLCILGGIHGHVSFATVAAGSVFLALTVGVLALLFRLFQEWETESDEERHV